MMTYLPFGESTGLNSLKQILTHKVRILTSCLLGLFPNKAGLTLQTLPMELNKLGFTLVGNHTEGMHTKAIDMTE